jgi:hypothetical protein
MARLAFILAVVFGIATLIARFAQPPLMLVIHPSTWLKVTGLLLGFSITTCLLGIADVLVKKEA